MFARTPKGVVPVVQGRPWKDLLRRQEKKEGLIINKKIMDVSTGSRKAIANHAGYGSMFALAAVKMLKIVHIETKAHTHRFKVCVHIKALGPPRAAASTPITWPGFVALEKKR